MTPDHAGGAVPSADTALRAVRSARTLPGLLSARAQATPDAEALRFEGRSVTYSELEAASRAMAQQLRQHAVGPGDRVAVLAQNGLDAPIAWFAILAARAVAVPVNVTYGARDLGYVLGHSGCSVVLSGPGQSALVDATRSSAPGVRLALTLADGALQSEVTEVSGSLLSEVEADPDDPVTIQYTSGTTGFPKGCVLHHGYWLRLARTVQGLAGLGPDDVLLTAQPQSYMDPTWNLVLGLLVGAPLVVLPRFSASRFWSEAAACGATFFYCIGTMPLYLLKQTAHPGLDREHRVRLVYCSGIPPSYHREMERRWGCPWRETYGSTELGIVLAATPDDDASVGSGSMGQPVEGREVSIAREGGRRNQPDTGELLVRGPDTMLRYHDDPEATRAWSVDGWAHTGDVVRVTERGFSLVGRTKDMIRRGGENISAAEVEAVLVEHPAVRAVACIPVDDDLLGEEVKAYVQPCVGASTSEADLHAFVAERLAPFKVPRYIELVDALPLTQSEKVAKAVLRASREDHVAGAWDAAKGAR